MSKVTIADLIRRDGRIPGGYDKPWRHSLFGRYAIDWKREGSQILVKYTERSEPNPDAVPLTIPIKGWST